jgi:hypothetical protein
MKEPPGTAAAGTPARRGRPAGGAREQYANLGEGASSQARRLAAAILEVLAGGRTPAQAAQALELSLPRYYVLEARALQGMLVACEPRSQGRTVSSESALAALRRECEQLRRECGRQQALVRAAQRTIGLAAPVTRAPERNGKKRRQRRPTARALKAAARLREEPCEPAPVAMSLEKT